ncbi:MAG TPA: hypothetical protein VIL46_06840 [Gemmataceae bacterium]
MKRVILCGGLVALLAAGAGCSSARHVVKEPTGGVVAIPSNSDFWPFYHRSQAEALMRRHLGPGGYEIVREEEVVTGAVTHHNGVANAHHVENEKKPGRGWTHESVSQTSHTQQTTEWHIHYRAK